MWVPMGPPKDRESQAKKAKYVQIIPISRWFYDTYGGCKPTQLSRLSRGAHTVARV